MPTKKKTTKPTKKVVKNGHNKKNGVHKNGAFKDQNLVSEFLGQPAGPVTTKPQPPSYRSLKDELGFEVSQFRDYLLSKYSDYHGHDMRRDVAWFLEQYGNGILSDIERAKRAEREKIIAENRAKEEAAAAQQEVAPK
jgi:hypothetical protein